MKTSIIVCFYERIEYLRCCLDSLVPSAGHFYEVIITDDGSEAKTVERIQELIARYPFRVRHVWQPKEGFRVAAARNNGVRHASGDYLTFLDCDFLVLPDTIRIHLELAAKRKFLSGYCKYLSKEITEQLFEKSIRLFNLEQLYNDIPDDNLKRDHRKFISRTWRIKLGLASKRKQTLGGHFSIHREDFESVNGYDEKYVGWGGEDIDLGIRLVSKGVYGRSIITLARVLHMWHPKELKDAEWTSGPNMYYFNRKKVKPFCEQGLKKKKSVFNKEME
jgi:glycosyltransferase involved in cell wall biosynthesis